MAAEISKKIGYADKDLKSVPEGANLGLGCGNPLALASLKEGKPFLILAPAPDLTVFWRPTRSEKRGRSSGWI